jgi:hypothetical protein
MISPVGLSLPFIAGGCAPKFRDTVFYKPKDRISTKEIVFECKEWPLSLYCSQEWFRPDYVPTESAGHWAQAWKVLGYCTGTISISGGDCPPEWTLGDVYNKYKENDQVSMVKTNMPLVKVIYKCKPWPNSWYCGKHSPVAYNGGKLGWDFVGECNPVTPRIGPLTTVAPTKSPVFVTLTSIGACPPLFTEAAYKPGDRVLKDSIVFECTSWPLSLYCAQEAFAPDLKSVTEYWKQAWQAIGHCTS